MAKPQPLEHLEEHVHVPTHWDLAHKEVPFVPSKMHPTKMHFKDDANNKVVEWSSRRHRKGRNFIVKHPETGERLKEPEDTHRIRGKKFWAWEFDNISWWVAQCFLWGSVAWVINGFAVWLQPFNTTRTADDLARISALVGGCIFLVGASLTYFEALNVHPKADKYIPTFFLEHHNAAKTKHKKPTSEGTNNEEQRSSNAGSPPQSPATPPSPSTPASPQSEVESTRDSGVGSDSDANAVAVAAASERLSKRMSMREEKRKSRALRYSLQLPKAADNFSPIPHSAPTTPTGARSPIPGTELAVLNPIPVPSTPPSPSHDDPDSPQLRSRAFSIISDSYNPNTSYVPSRRSSVSSVDTASSSYDSDYPDRVPTPTPPPSPKAKPQEKEEEPEEEKKFKVKGSRWREIGYLAAVSQLIGAYVFFISCVTGMHNVIDEDSVGQVQGAYWAPQVIGGMGFVISGSLYMYEVQPSWWKLQPQNIGWEIGFWNWLGAIGFTLCGIFGFYAFEGWGQEWGTAFSTFWGGWAFLIGSYIQLLEAINK